MIKYPLPTGYLFVDEYEKGQLETLSIGDYGKHHNVKADFLGLYNEINGVPNTTCMPLQEKWVITLSTQYGCPQKCLFCAVPNIPFKGNVSEEDLRKQLIGAMALFPDVNYVERLNIHFARMGEPIFNRAVFDFAVWLQDRKESLQALTGTRIETMHPVLTTSLPRGFKQLENRLQDWASIKNDVYHGQAGLQFSINSTDDVQRDHMFQGKSITLAELARITDRLPMPLGRKYCLNFAFSSDYIIDAKRLQSMFDPEVFMVKITPIHNNDECAKNNIKTVGGYTEYTPYRKAEDDLKAAGFDVLVFVPSMDEENSLITCGNAILGGSRLSNELQPINIKGVKS